MQPDSINHVLKNQTFSGIEVLGNIAWGTHVCQFYETEEDLLEIIIPYFKTGLENNEYCMWITSDPITPEEAIQVLKKAVPGIDQYMMDQKIEILPHVSWYTKASDFVPQSILDGWDEKLTQALNCGCTGMRITGNAGWIDNKRKKDLFEYERELNDFLNRKRIIALCTYPLKKSQASDVLDVALLHESTIAKRNGSWEIVEAPENKKTKAQIQMLNTELEQRVRERTRELAQAVEELKHEMAEHKKAEDELRLAYQRLSYHFENTPLAIVEWDKDYCIKRWSKRAEEIFGWKESEVLGVKMDDPGIPIVYIDDLPAVNKIADQLMKGDVNGKLSMNRNNTKDGNVIYCEWYNSVLRDEHGNVITILSLVHNVTERIKAEEQKDFEQREKEALINSTDDLIWSVSSDYKLIAFNQAFSQVFKAMTGMPSKPGDEIVVSDAFTDDIRDFWKESYDIALSGKTFEVEIHTQAINQLAESWRENAFNPIYKDKTVVAVACYSRDITERKKAEKILVESENYLRTIIQTEPHCVKLLNINGDLENMNPAGLKMIEVDSLEDIKGKSVMDLINEPYRRAFKNLIQNVFKGNTETLEFEITGYKGTQRWMETHAVPLKNAEGNILSLLGISLDITQRKKAEEELLQLNEELRMLSSHLQNVREEERIQISRNVHDELGQQLTGLKLDVNWLKRKLETEDDSIKQKINGIIELIDETLQSVRKISSDLRPSLLDDFGLVDALEWHSEEVAKRSEIKVDFNSDMPEVDIPVVTETGIFRIFQELLTNAVRHANAKVITSSLQLNNNHIILNVKDDGRGMDPLATDTKNTLGLIGIKERTFALGGKLDFKSRPGKGTEVQISIPL